MAFDLVQYFNDQIKIQKPQLLNSHPKQQQDMIIHELNCLTLGKLISSLREDEQKLYNEIHQFDDLYIQEISRHLTTSHFNQSTLETAELETTLFEILNLHFIELKQLDNTASLGLFGFKELLLGQIEFLSGQAEDWVWSTNNLLELKGTKPILTEDISLEDTLKEFNQMAIQHQNHSSEEVIEVKEPTWAKIVEPLVALAVLWVIADALCKVFAS